MLVKNAILYENSKIKMADLWYLVHIRAGSGPPSQGCLVCSTLHSFTSCTGRDLARLQILFPCFLPLLAAYLNLISVSGRDDTTKQCGLS